ncbi:MAG: hypothetical protein O6846_03930 [Thaumarchaeota archaeon]|nr:hypothetical protein [Nitrososphaerota archaeon]
MKVTIKRTEGGEFYEALFSADSGTKFNVGWERFENFLKDRELLRDNEFVSQFEITETGISVTVDEHD